MPNKRRAPGSLAEQAYAHIRTRILKGELALGAPLSRRKLAAELGMSFIPVSEAIKRLEQDGLVESRPRVGTRIRVPTARDLRERCVMREALEAQAARMFAEKASPMECLELRSLAARLDTRMERSAAASHDPDLSFRAQMNHLAFHTRIAECTGCTALCRDLEKNQVLIFNWLYDIAVDYRMPAGWHAQLVEALISGNADAAESAMRRHVRYGMEDIHSEIGARFGSNWSTLGNEPGGKISAGPGSGAWRQKATSRSLGKRA